MSNSSATSPKLKGRNSGESIYSSPCLSSKDSRVSINSSEHLRLPLFVKEEAADSEGSSSFVLASFLDDSEKVNDWVSDADISDDYPQDRSSFFEVFSGEQAQNPVVTSKG